MTIVWKVVSRNYLGFLDIWEVVYAKDREEQGKINSEKKKIEKKSSSWRLEMAVYIKITSHKKSG